MSSSQLSKSREIRLKSIQNMQKNKSSHDPLQKETLHTAIEDMTLELQQLEKQKQKLTEQTKREIAEQRQQWETEKQTYIEAARDEGYKAGFKSGEAASIDEYQNLIARANQIVQQTEIDYHKEMELNEEAIVQLAVHIAEKILQQTLEKQPESFIGIVKAVLQNLKEAGHITIYVHPENFENVLQQKGELTGILEETQKISIYADESLTINSCIIEHPYGQVDANVDTQLEQIRTTLLEIASTGSADESQ